MIRKSDHLWKFTAHCLNRAEIYFARFGRIPAHAMQKHEFVTTGIKKDLATLQIAIIQNPSGLEGAGSGYYIPSANSGEPVTTLRSALFFGLFSVPQSEIINQKSAILVAVPPP